jgi:hypothetical protein
MLFLSANARWSIWVKQINRLYFSLYELKKKEFKESRNSPGVAQRDPAGLGSQISMTFGTSRWWA